MWKKWFRLYHLLVDPNDTLWNKILQWVYCYIIAPWKVDWSKETYDDASEEKRNKNSIHALQIFSLLIPAIALRWGWIPCFIAIPVGQMTSSILFNLRYYHPKWEVAIAYSLLPWEPSLEAIYYLKPILKWLQKGVFFTALAAALVALLTSTWMVAVFWFAVGLIASEIAAIIITLVVMTFISGPVTKPE